jgi:hypothetical protein
MADSGTIKWFSNAKGFGFIVNEKGNGVILCITVPFWLRAIKL